MIGLDVSGMVLDLSALEDELAAGGCAVPYGLTLEGPARTELLMPGEPNVLPEGTYLYTHDEAGEPAELPACAASIVQAHAVPL